MSLSVERSCPWRSVHTSNWPNVAYPAAYRLWSATSFCGRAVDSSPCSSPTVVCYLVSCWRAPPRPCFCTSAASAPLRLGSPRVGPLLPPSYGLHLGPLPRLLASSLWPPTRPSILWPSSFPPSPPSPLYLSCCARWGGVCFAHDFFAMLSTSSPRLLPLLLTLPSLPITFLTTTTTLLVILTIPQLLLLLLCLLY